MNAKNFKTVCIIMIIFGVLGLLGSFSTLTGGGLSVVAGILAIATNALNIVAGFLGNKAVKTGDADQAPLCRTLSYIILAVAAVSLVVGVVLTKNAPVPEGVSPGFVTGIALISSIVSLILPVLYFFGARKLGK